MLSLACRVRRQEPQRQQRDVVVQASPRALHGRPLDVLEQALQAQPGGLATQPAQPAGAQRPVRLARLCHAVGEQQQGLAGVQLKRVDGVFEASELGGQAERQASVDGQPAAGSVGVRESAGRDQGKPSRYASLFRCPLHASVAVSGSRPSERCCDPPSCLAWPGEQADDRFAMT